MIQQITGLNSIQAYTENANQAQDKDFSNILTMALNKAENHTAIFNDLKDQYNIRSATFEEVNEMSQKLYKMGVITLKEHAAITFDYGRATQHIKAVNGAASPNFSMYETNADDLGRRDWIDEFEARAAKNKQYGNWIGYAMNKKIISILQLIERT